MLQPGTYRVRPRGRNAYLDTFPMPGVLRIDAAAPPAANATLTLDQAPDGRETGTYEGSVRARGDSATLNLLCEGCRIRTRFGENYTDLTYGGEFGVRSIGGGRFVLTEGRTAHDPARPFVDTLVRVDP